jgi:hypothetical protein
MRSTIHHNLALSTELRTRLLILLFGSVLFLPPSVTMYSNPPPSDLVLTWWLRFSVSLAVSVLSVVALFGRNRVRSWTRSFHYLVFAVATLTTVLLLEWPLEFPYLFGLSDTVHYWWSH